MQDTLGRMRLAADVDFEEEPYRWEGRITAENDNTITVEVSLANRSTS